MGGLGEGNSQSRSVFAGDRHGRKRCITFGLVDRETVDNQKAGGSEWYCLTGQPAFCPSFPNPFCADPPPCSTYRAATKKPWLCLPFQLGELYAHRTPHRIC